MERIVIVILATALIALFFSRIHFHFHFALELSRAKESRWKSPTPVRKSIRPETAQWDGKYMETRREEGQAAREALGRVDRPPVRTITREMALKSVREAVQASAEADVCSALVNLGLDKKKAVSVAKAAMLEGEDFDSRIKWAIQHASNAA